MHASATDDLVILVAFAGDEDHVPRLRLPDGRFDGLTAIGHHPVPAPCGIQRLPKARFHFRDDGHRVLAAQLIFQLRAMEHQLIRLGAEDAQAIVIHKLRQQPADVAIVVIEVGQVQSQLDGPGQVAALGVRVRQVEEQLLARRFLAL